MLLYILFQLATCLDSQNRQTGNDNFPAKFDGKQKDLKDLVPKPTQSPSPDPSPTPEPYVPTPLPTETPKATIPPKIIKNSLNTRTKKLMIALVVLVAVVVIAVVLMVTFYCLDKKKRMIYSEEEKNIQVTTNTTKIRSLYAISSVNP